MEHLIEEKPDLSINEVSVTSEEIQLDVIIHNISSAFNSGCMIDFKKIPKKYLPKFPASQNVSLKANNCTIVIRHTGKLQGMGASSEDEALSSAKKSIEMLQSWGIEATLKDFRILSFFCSCLLPWRVRIEALVTKHNNVFTYEPEIYNFCIMKLKKGQGFFGLYPTGFIRVIGITMEMVFNILERALPLISEFRVKV